MQCYLLLPYYFTENTAANKTVRVSGCNATFNADCANDVIDGYTQTCMITEGNVIIKVQVKAGSVFAFTCKLIS